jgi:hypothetical protein
MMALETRHKIARHRPNLALANRYAIDLHHRQDMHAGTGDETLVKIADVTAMQATLGKRVPGLGG